MTSTLSVRSPATKPSPAFSRNGWATASTSRATSAVRIANSSHCSSRMRREFFFIAASRKSIAAQGTSRNRRLFHRWIKIGAAAAASHPSISRLAKPNANRKTGAIMLVYFARLSREAR